MNNFTQQLLRGANATYNSTIAGHEPGPVPDWAVGILSALGILLCMAFVICQAEGGRK